MIISVTSSREPANPCIYVCAPFAHGLRNISNALSGSRWNIQPAESTNMRSVNFHEVQQSRSSRSSIKYLKLSERVSSFGVGLILLIPIINTIVYAILRKNGSVFVKRPTISYHYSSMEPLDEEISEMSDDESFESSSFDYFRRINSLHSYRRSTLAQEPTLPVPVPTSEIPQFQIGGVVLEPVPELVAQRKQMAIEELQRVQEGLPDQQINPALLTFDFDVLLSRYSSNYPISEYNNLVNYVREPRNSFSSPRLSANFSYRYSTARDPQTAKAKAILSKIYHYFLIKHQPITSGSEEETALKEQITQTIRRINDAHQNCVDQVLTQLEDIALELLGNDAIDATSSNSANSLALRAAQSIYLYKTRTFLEACHRVSPNESHQASYHRLMKQMVFRTDSSINEVGARYGNMIHNARDKANRVRDYFNRNFDPISYFGQDLQNYFNINRKFRNDLLIWANEYLATDQEDDLTTQVLESFSEAAEHDAFIMGGNLTQDGVIALLRTANIIENATEEDPIRDDYSFDSGHIGPRRTGRFLHSPQDEDEPSGCHQS